MKTHTRNLVLSLMLSLSLEQEFCSRPDLEYLCSSGECIKREYLCDGSSECSDGSDETHNLCHHRTCSQSFDYIDRQPGDIFSVRALGNNQNFVCSYGACISRRFICNGIRNCIADGSDETKELCKDTICGRHQFQCDYGGCILRRYMCDNRYHCVDQSDETPDACRRRRRSCHRKTFFMCANGACVRKGLKCNGRIDCLDESDESEETCGPSHKPNLNSSISIPVTQFPRNQNPPETTKPTLEITVVAPAITKPSISEGNSNGCLLSDDANNIGIEIIRCGEGSCDGAIFPVDTVMLAFCDDTAIPLRCEDDKLWHFVRDKARTPVVKPCQDPSSLAHPQEPSVPVSLTGLIRSKPSECGTFPPFFCFPWLVGLFREEEFACTGVLIAPGIILTAGHCVSRTLSSTIKMDAADLKIQYKSKEQNDPSTFASVSHIEIHPTYSGGGNLRYDIALLFLSTDLELGSACLDTEGRLLGVAAWTFNRTMGERAYHWSPFQQTLGIDCINKATQCSRHLNIGSNQFCGANEDSPLYLHQGSSGGPYMIEKNINGKTTWFVAGIVSYSISTSKCGTPVSVFTSVSNLLDWIEGCSFQGNCSV